MRRKGSINFILTLKEKRSLLDTQAVVQAILRAV